MTDTMFSTESFEVGSEFRVEWVNILNKKSRRGYAETIQIKHSEIFTTYEEASKFSKTIDSLNIWIQVRRPGNKNFRLDRDTKTV